MSALLIGYEEDFDTKTSDKVEKIKLSEVTERQERAIRREETKQSKIGSTPRGVRTRSQADQEDYDGPPPPKARKLNLEPILITIDNPDAGSSFTRPNFEDQPEIDEVYDDTDAAATAADSSGRVSTHERLAPLRAALNATLVVEENVEEDNYGDERYGEEEEE